MHLYRGSLRRLRILALILLLALCGSQGVRHATAQALLPPLTLADYRQALLEQRPSYLAAPATLQTAQVSPNDLVPGTATVTFAPDVNDGAAESAIASLGATVTSSVPGLNVYQVALPAGWSVDAGITALAALPNALRAEPVVQLHPSFHPDDPLYEKYQQPYLQQIHAEEAWDIQQGDPNVVVAVLDSGVTIDHPDLRGQIWTNPNPGQSGCGNDLHGCNFVDQRFIDASCPNANTGSAPNPNVVPYFFHGTFVAGVIGAATNNGIGVAGIVRHASIMPVTIGDCVGPLSTALANGIMYAVANGAAVINLSIGASNCDPMPSYVLNAINQAERQGVTVVAASGNDGLSCVGSPANYSGVVAVGATARSGDVRAKFSDWGPEIAVVAPGERIVSTSPPRDATPPNDLYRFSDGTSFSAPMVAGLADLLLSQNPLLTPSMVRSLIQKGATPLADNNQPGWDGAGRIDLAASLRLVPAAFYGRVRVNGADVPAGTPVEARIGAKLCGQATTTTRSGQAIVTIFVAPAADQPGCGTPGAQVTLTVNGTPAATIPFKAGAVTVDTSGAPQTSTSVTAVPTAGVALYHAGWNLVAGPAGTRFTGARGSLYTLQPGDSDYRTLNASGPIAAGAGYWAYFTADTTVTLGPDGPQSASVQVPPGQFAMIGNPSASRAVTVSGADVVYTFDPTQNSYVTTTTLQPGQGAWVLSANGGTVALN